MYEKVAALNVVTVLYDYRSKVLLIHVFSKTTIFKKNNYILKIYQQSTLNMQKSPYDEMRVRTIQQQQKCVISLKIVNFMHINFKVLSMYSLTYTQIIRLGLM